MRPLIITLLARALPLGSLSVAPVLHPVVSRAKAVRSAGWSNPQRFASPPIANGLQQLRDDENTVVEEITSGSYHLQRLWPLSKGSECRATNQSQETPECGSGRFPSPTYLESEFRRTEQIRPKCGRCYVCCC